MKRLILILLCLAAVLSHKKAQAQTRGVDNPKPEQVKKDTTAVVIRTGPDGKKKIIQTRTVEIEAVQDSAEYVQERFNRAYDAMLNLRAAAAILLNQKAARDNFRKLSREYRDVAGRTFQREYIRSGRAQEAAGIYLFRDFERNGNTVIALHYEGRDTLRECRYTVDDKTGTFKVTAYPTNGKVFTINWYNPDFFEISGNLAQGIAKAEFFLIGQVPDDVEKDRGRKFYGDLLLPLGGSRFQLVKLRETEENRNNNPGPAGIPRRP